MSELLKESTVANLKHGDIFKLGRQVWDGILRLDSIHFYNDKLQKWVERKDFNSDCRICFWLLSPYYDDGFKGVFKWSDTNTLEEKVYIPEFKLCEWKRLKGKPCTAHGNHREVFPYQLNEINISKEYHVTIKK